MASFLIKAENIDKIYSNESVETRAVQGVSFNLTEGEFVAIMGPSGSGKSTLMQILGFLDYPTEGRYLFRGKDTKNFSADELAKIRNEEVGFVFQTFNLLPRATVLENVELPLLYDTRKSNKEENTQKIKKALEEVGMVHRINHFSNQLSGGERQRVAIARALVNSPAVVFADEPTGNLDSKSGIQVMKILQDLNNEGKTIILVTHEGYTAQHAKRILQMVDGQIIKDESIAERRMADGEKELK
ncbi:MAG: ABC transporter ATP-binding protein [Patescibacteria group bacterium]|nr:ABC transporter ATP-binding protein [Patescibacteria group bacterium]